MTALRQVLAEALAEKFTSDIGARNPDWDIDRPDGPDNAYCLTVPMSERIDRPPYLVTLDADGGRSISMPSCADLVDALLPAAIAWMEARP